MKEDEACSILTSMGLDPVEWAAAAADAKASTKSAMMACIRLEAIHTAPAWQVNRVFYELHQVVEHEERESAIMSLFSMLEATAGSGVEGGAGAGAWVAVEAAGGNDERRAPP